MPLDARTANGCVTFAICVRPAAKRNEVVGLYGNAVKIALTAPAMDGKANDALVRFLANRLGVPRLSVAIAAGHASHSKVIRVVGLTAEQVATRLMPIEAV